MLFKVARLVIICCKAVKNKYTRLAAKLLSFFFSTVSLYFPHLTIRFLGSFVFRVKDFIISIFKRILHSLKRDTENTSNCNIVSSSNFFLLKKLCSFSMNECTCRNLFERNYACQFQGLNI